VALTRAEQACFVQLENIVKHLKAGPKGLLMNSAIGYLLEQNSVSIDALNERFSEVIGEGKLSLHYYPDWLAKMETITVPENAHQPENLVLSRAQFKGQVWDNWRLTSYSQLAKLDTESGFSGQGHSGLGHSESHHSDIVLDSGSQFDTDAEIDSQSEPEAVSTNEEKALTPFDFPKGATPGTCLHGILENWDFIDHDQLAEQVENQLKYYGIDNDYGPMLIDWMAKVVGQPLAEAQCCLADVSETNRLVEMEFYLPMTEIRASGVMPLLDGRRLAFEPMRGQLKGFIDLIFRHDGRYYVADYKSNYLGDQISDYQPAALKDAMEHHQYDLQYWIYSIAVDQYLSRRIPNYDYETHFGGVYYFFLRGMNGKTDGEGVFFTRPERSQLEKWRSWLLGSDSIDVEATIMAQADNQQMGLF
jgi:exodeoxyribonuclease V beta subunit